MFLNPTVPLAVNNNNKPAKPIVTPNIFLGSAFNSKNKMPTVMVNNGVNAFNIPASELSIFVSAIQNKNAGKKLPINPDKITSPTLPFGICLMALNTKGSNTTPALKMRKAAT